MRPKILFIILDGAAEFAHSAFAAAKTPYLDKLASNSELGIWSGPHAHNFNPKSMSSIGTLEILGYSEKDEPGRGYLEALGIGLNPTKNHVCLRANFATIDKNRNIIDRRAGRDGTGLKNLIEYLNKNIKPINGVKFRLHKAAGHRAVLVMSGKGISKLISDSDTKSKMPEKIKPLKKQANKTADILNRYMEIGSELLESCSINKKRNKPANFLLLRSAGSKQKAEPFEKRFGMSACSVSSIGIIRGISKYTGISIYSNIKDEEIEENIELKINLAIKALKKYDFVLLHINGTDIFSHSRLFKQKVRFIEMLDRNLFSRITKLNHICKAVISDHQTSSDTGEHIFGPVPFLIYNPEFDIEEKKRFTEESCSRGFKTDNPMKKLIACIKGD